MKNINISKLSIILILLLSSCAPPPTPEPTPTPRPTITPSGMIKKGDMLVYYAQSGDTIPALSSRFNITPESILKENPLIPRDITTLPPGLPLDIFLGEEPDWGTPYRIIPDSLYVNGPEQADFDPVLYVNGTKGWLKNYTDVVEGYYAKGGNIIDAVGINYSVSPRLLLAILEYQLHALSDNKVPNKISLGSDDPSKDTLYKEIYWAANILNDGYYSWREGKKTNFKHLNNGQVETPDPSLNAASFAIQYYFSKIYDGQQYQDAISPAGFTRTYESLFGKISWESTGEKNGIPGNLQQPSLSLPFAEGQKWAYTGGPHSGWGSLEPFAAVDFAPPAETPGCEASPLWALSMSDGIVARSVNGVVLVSLDPNGIYQRGWSLFYLHISPSSAPKVGTKIKVGDKIGHPSCEGGHATGRHIHIARRFNGEWIPASGVLAFNLGGWVAAAGEDAYTGTLSRADQVKTANINGIDTSQIEVDAGN